MRYEKPRVERTRMLAQMKPQGTVLDTEDTLDT